MERGNQLFDWLVKYHIDTNLLPNLPLIEQGRFLKRDGTPIPEGEENHYATGCLILSDGDSLVRRLKEENIILDLSDPVFVPAGNYQLFTGYLSGNQKKDGAFVYDGKNKSMTRISRYNNRSSELMQKVRENYTNYLPPNFVHETAAEMTARDYDDDIGTKTDLAMVLPVSHTKEEEGSYVHSYQIKATATQLGLGKVAHFGPNGLIEEFFFRYDPKSEGPFVVPEQGIVGVHRTYKIDPRSSELIVASQRLIDPAANSRKCRDCKCYESVSLV